MWLSKTFYRRFWHRKTFVIAGLCRVVASFFSAPGSGSPSPVEVAPAGLCRVASVFSRPLGRLPPPDRWSSALPRQWFYRFCLLGTFKFGLVCCTRRPFVGLWSWPRFLCFLIKRGSGGNSLDRQIPSTQLHSQAEGRAGPMPSKNSFFFFMWVQTGFELRTELSDTPDDPGSQLPYQEFPPYYPAPI